MAKPTNLRAGSGDTRCGNCTHFSTGHCNLYDYDVTANQLSDGFKARSSGPKPVSGVSFSQAEYELQLAAARERLLNLAVTFDPAKHPHDAHGRFRSVLKELKPGQSARLPNGVEVFKRPPGVDAPQYKVTSPDGHVMGEHDNPDRASGRAFDYGAPAIQPGNTSNSQAHRDQASATMSGPDRVRMRNIERKLATTKNTAESKALRKQRDDLLAKYK